MQKRVFLSTLLSLFVTTSLAKENKVSIRHDAEYRYITGNGYPKSHGHFPNRGNPHQIKTQKYRFRMPLKPKKAFSKTPVGHNLFGVALDGIPFDPGSNEYWRGKRRSGWNYEANSAYVHLGLDFNHAHVQPNGAYHYHGLPTTLFKKQKEKAGHSQMILLGYAADGFPIYGVYGHLKAMKIHSKLIEMKSSYRLKKGHRAKRGGPGGMYDGRFVEDYEYIYNGQLDDCNGRFGVTREYPKGTYYYVISKSFPYVPRCLVGTPDESFKKAKPPGRRPPPRHIRHRR